MGVMGFFVRFFLLFVIVLFTNRIVSSTEKTEVSKVVVKGEFKGKSIEYVKKRALKNALRKAVEFNGIEIRTSEIMSTSEAKGGVKGSYGAVTESKSVVEISSFKIIKEESRIINNNEIYFAMEVEVELIKPNTKLDEHFNVSLDVNKVDFFEHEKIELSIKSNQTGYLTLLMESENGYYVLFPNSLERNNKIEANSTFTFPPSINNYMSITASLNGEDDEETTQIIAVVTKSDVPLSVSPKMKIHDNRLKIKEVSEMEMIKWKLDIPLSTRSQDERLITVRRKRKDNKVYEYESR